MAEKRTIKQVRAVLSKAPSRELLLQLNDLRVSYGSFEALRGYSLDLAPGEIHVIAGESGSGKSTILKAILGLTSYSAEVTGGSIRFAGNDVLAMSGRERRALLGDEIGLIAQNPAASFNPLRTFRAQFKETLESTGGNWMNTKCSMCFRPWGFRPTAESSTAAPMKSAAACVSGWPSPS